MFTVIGISHFISKKGNPLVAIYCTADRKNVEGTYCECFVVSESIFPSDLMLGSTVEFKYPKNSGWCEKVIVHG